MIIYCLNNGPRKGNIVVSFPEVYEAPETLGYEVRYNGTLIQSDDDLDCLVLGPLESREFEDPLTPHNIHEFKADFSDPKNPKIVKGGIKFKAFTKKQSKANIEREFDIISKIRIQNPNKKIKL